MEFIVAGIICSSESIYGVDRVKSSRLLWLLAKKGFSLSCFRFLLEFMDIKKGRVAINREAVLLISDFNDTAVHYPKEMLIHELFEQQVERTPEALAVQYEGEGLTYAELNAKANQLAHRLREMRDETGGAIVGPDALVAISVERSLEMVVGLLGILKAGAAYVPVDPEYPAERIAYMLEDSQARVLLTQKRLQERLAGAVQAADGGIEEIVLLDEGSTYAGQPERSIGRKETGQTSSNLAYVIYTSGSTGLPKGVMIEHSGVGNLALLLQKELRVDETSRVLQFASFSFDACVWEVVVSLLHGASLQLSTKERLMPGEPLRALLQERGITHAMLPPMALSALGEPEGLESLQTVSVGGDVCPPQLAQQWSDAARFVNAYGPTEATVCATMFRVEAEWAADAGQSLPIGGPVANARVYILDEQRKPVPLGVAGELYVGGAGVARGYLNRAELTAERFMDDPFSDDPGARMYRTGDLGRWRADGLIEYLGRNDFQVKIRGFRIELGEIEARLAELPGVRDAVVIAREDHPGDKRLVAYWTVREELPEEALPDVEQLRDHLKAELPAYMVPSAFVKLEAMPLTPNGKVDRKALPVPDAEAVVRHEYEAPQGPVEEVLAGIWQELLGVDRVGRNDSFFDLGGHSLLAVQLMQRMAEQGVSTTLASLFQEPTVSAQARYGSSAPDSDVWDSYIVSMRKGTGDPLFFIHEAMGESLPYVELTTLLSGEFPVYGIEASWARVGDRLLSSVEHLASMYAKAIRRVQPNGAYRLAGWSGGGLLAYETARQLQLDGSTVSFVGMIDSYVHGVKEEEISDYVGKMMAIRTVEFMNKLGMGDAAESLGGAENIDGVFDEAERNGLIPVGFTKEWFVNRVEVASNIAGAFMVYTPASAVDNAFVFCATEPMENLPGGEVFYRSPDRGWGIVGRGSPVMIDVGGSHRTIMEYPHLGNMAACFNELLSSS